MRALPCADPTLEGNAAVVATVQPNDTVTYANAHTQQTSRCGAAFDAPGQGLCWIEATLATGERGWLPAARGAFKDALCAPADGANIESLVDDACGECLLDCCCTACRWGGGARSTV